MTERNKKTSFKDDIPVYISPLEYEMVFIPLMDQPLLLFSTMIYDMGLRATNLMKLTYGDLLDAPYGYIRFPKNRDVNLKVYLSANVQVMINTAFLNRHSSNEYLFAAPNGRRWTPSVISKKYIALSKCAGVVINEVSLFYSWCCNFVEYGGKRGKKSKDVIASLMNCKSSLYVK